MAKDKKVEVEEEVVEDTEEVATPKKSVKRDEVTVTFRLGSRVYSREVHGDDFEDLAKQFVAKHGGEIS